MNVLFVGAHHDDLEVSSGGSVKRWVEEGCNVFSAILTDSTWTGPDGIRFRDPQQVESYCQRRPVFWATLRSASTTVRVLH